MEMAKYTLELVFTIPSALFFIFFIVCEFLNATLLIYKVLFHILKPYFDSGCIIDIPHFSGDTPAGTANLQYFETIVVVGQLIYSFCTHEFIIAST